MGDDNTLRPSSELYLDQLDSVLYRHERSHQYQFLLSTVRSILQTTAMSLLEYCTNFVDDVEDGPLPVLAERMLRPSDGIFEKVISEAAALARQNGWRAADAWTTGGDAALRRRVNAWSAHRNKHAGHGIVSMNVVDEALTWLPDLARDLINGLAAVLPLVAPSGTTYLALDAGQPLELKTVRMPTGQPIVIREIVQRGDIWRFRFQVLDASESTEGTYEVSGDPSFLGISRQDLRACLMWAVWRASCSR
ncbi:hypothetical protein [Actinomadura opuntiae]|uniref:hypothetical protein n=1 Tax=Actinomadura sp. OS1-43 TaxID=604315 RepID=UPI00255B1AEE|nr:hypothetical protein [Actinomadura sp. OS1-43]MDL4816595.1 hypothetical protein [Actinomadura sp. OS1-43]